MVTVGNAIPKYMTSSYICGIFLTQAVAIEVVDNEIG